jgi:hypothetical protein
MTTTQKAAPRSSTSKAATTDYTNAHGPIPDEALDSPDHQVRPLTEQQRKDSDERVAALKKHKPQ